MVRLGSLINNTVTVIGIIVLVIMGALGLALVCATFVACVALHHWRAILAGVLVAVLLSACTTVSNESPRDARDPQIWRPAAPIQYPLPR